MKRPLILLIADGASVVNSATSSLRGVLTSIFDLISVVLTIICAVGLTITLGRWLFSDHDGKEALIKWSTGFILSIILLGIVKLAAG